MSVVSWVTPRGILGTVPENEYYSYQLQATDSDEQPLFYSFISGELPGGVYINNSGELRGIPTILSSVGQKAVYSFTIRATNPNGTVADRSFILNVNNVKGPQIIPRPDLIGAWFDGNFLDYTFQSINDNPVATEIWSVIRGDLPPGTTFTSEGRISGYLDIIANNTTELGYEASPIEAASFDVQPISKDKFYNFTVQVTDGAKYDTVNVRVLVVSKSGFTADNAITLINNSFITIDISSDDKYRPIILNPPTSLPTLVAGSIFAYKFLAYDPEDEDVSWAIEENANSGMDELDAAIGEVKTGLGTQNITLGFSSTTSRVVVFLNEVRQVGFVDYTVAGSILTFITATPSTTDVVFVQYIQNTTGFDTLKFDQGSSTIPSGLRIDARSGWIIGALPTVQEEDIKSYEFNVQAFRTFYPQLVSKKVTFILNVKRSVNEQITWNTPADIGTIENGAISEIEISATNTLGKELQYSIVYEPYKRTPQGLKFLKTGIFTGRVTFRYFTLDGTVAILNVQSSEDLAVGMTVQGVGVAAGCEITAIVDSNTIEVRPAIYVTQGSILTFTNSQISKSVSTTSNAISTNIDNGGTTFDRTCGFTVKAQATDFSISSTKTFTIKVQPRNLAPYENVYLKALPKQEQREALKEILDNNDIFPTDLLYRPNDPYFGLQKNLKFLFLPGLSTSTAANFVGAIANNHYFKSINFGDVKTARAVDSRGNVTYEVVYVDVVDTQSYSTSGPPLKITPTIKNKFLYDTESYNDIYPNSFPNMKYRLESGIGYSNRGSLPTWMTSVQEDGRVLGLTRGVVLAYTKPNSAKLIAYRLAESGFEINSISFVADRYQWDNYLSKFYNTDTNTFEPSRSTTFDRSPDTTSGDLIETTVKAEVINSNSITIQTNINVGYGWLVSGRDSDSDIPAGTTVTAARKNVGETVLTLSNNLTASVDAAIRIDGKTQVDYAVFVPFNSINGALLGYVRSRLLIDGTANFVENETIVFAKQEGYFDSPEYDGWVDETGTIVPGFLEKLSDQTSTVINKRGGVWKLGWTDLPIAGFDSDGLGFDQASPGITQSRFDQGRDSEVILEFVREIILRQTVKVRTGRSFPQTTLEYTNAEGRAVPTYRPFNFVGAPSGLETTFDGGTCVMRAGYTPGTGVSAGGTTFSSNRDKYIIPETEDKYIKFPQTGVFV